MDFILQLKYLHLLHFSEISNDFVSICMTCKKIYSVYNFQS